MTIGAWSTIGAGAVVIRNLPGNVTAVGVPAKIIETRENEERITPD
jgi:acetyltransferase-like isoleucine patch superfamily enzyme